MFYQVRLWLHADRRRTALNSRPHQVTAARRDEEARLWREPIQSRLPSLLVSARVAPLDLSDAIPWLIIFDKQKLGRGRGDTHQGARQSPRITVTASNP